MARRYYNVTVRTWGWDFLSKRKTGPFDGSLVVVAGSVNQAKQMARSQGYIVLGARLA